MDRAESALLAIVPTRPIVSINSDMPKHIVHVRVPVYLTWLDCSR